VCSGAAVSMRELLEKLIARARVQVSVAVDAARYRPNDTPLLLGDPTAIRERFGWTPQIPMDRTIDDLLEYWRGNTEHWALMKGPLAGGTGYLGQAIARALAGRHHDLVLFSRSASRAGGPGTAFDGDVRDRIALERAAAGCDALIHTAALVSIWRRRRQDFDDVNVGGLRNVIAAAAAARVQRIVYTSSFLALPPHGESAPLHANDYQRTKTLADAVADEAVRGGVPIVRVYPGVVYGPGTFSEGNLLGRLIADHLKYRLPALVGPENRWSFSFVDDVAA